jgi:iron(III) transport system ATP-binding protein
MIEFKDVEIKYGDFVAMNNINLTVNEGEFFTLLGPSGCGKTTTLRSLVGFVSPTQGDIIVNNKRVNDIAVEKRRISMVFQSYALFPTMNVYDNIAFGLTVKKMTKKEVDEQVRDIAKKVDLTDEQLMKKVSELSGGQQQRVAIARALVLKPKILVLDEPLSNLDAKLRHQLRQELKNLQKTFGITSIYVTHDQEEALTLSDRIAVFNKGKIEQIGTPKEIYNKSKTEFVCNFVGSVNQIPAHMTAEINANNAYKLDNSKDAYVRLEKIANSEKGIDHPIVLNAEVIDAEFFGMYFTYTYQVGNITVKNIRKDDGRENLEIGDQVKLFIDPAHVMQF